MIDIDGKDALDINAVKLHFENIKPEVERMHVVLIHVTPSGKGLRLLVHCHIDGMEETIKRCTETLGLAAYGEVDPACKDLSRLSYLVPADYIVYCQGLMRMCSGKLVMWRLPMSSTRTSSTTAFG